MLAISENGMSNNQKYKADLEALVDLKEKMQLDLSFRCHDDQRDLDEKHKDLAKKVKGSIEKDYQRWYTESCAVIKQFVPDRLVEFEQLYKGDEL